ncbi:protease SohB [Pelagibaculum spongiae]|uniref:Protease SohB n=1 Tax=Pelagibaculum spongiae TaxID=2080658 RepID=A0A2V1GU78_9GAMM|nr:protease SohB [Pelagibaculum spongiae]PVZ69569.1 protease SohB [Pelagibaculum spongiae]
MEWLSEYGLFLAKTITFVIAAGVLIAIVASGKGKSGGKEGQLETRSLNEHFKSLEMSIRSSVMDEKAFKEWSKAQKKAEKTKQKQDKQKNSEAVTKPRMYVLDFNGDIQASAVTNLREEISAILLTAEKDDQVLLKLESGGGTVHGYGLAAAQLQRIKDHGLKLTASVDKVAASGGYMMVAVADEIVSAPFAIIGSIGVLAQIPNFHRLLKKSNIDFEQLSAGEYKRTLSLFGETTDKAREKLQVELEETHELFKSHIEGFRPQVDMSQVATGEHWYGKQALDLKLVDAIQTSDEYLMSKRDELDLIEISYSFKKGLKDKIPGLAASSVDSIVDKIWTRMLKQRHM